MTSRVPSRCLIALSLLLSALIETAGATTYHVSPLGSNTPPYTTYQSAAHRVADAANLATTPGDTVLIHAGSYTSTDTIYIATGVIFAGVGRDSVTLNWGGSESEPARMISLADGNEVYGLEFRNPLGDFWNPDVGALHTFSLGHLSIHDCLFSEVYVYLDGDGTLEFFDNYVYKRQEWALYAGRSENRIHDNVFEDGGTGILASYAGLVIVNDNVFRSGLAQTFLVAMETYLCDSVEFRNNLVYNSNWTIVWQFAPGVIENNTFVRARYKYATMFVFLNPDEQLAVRNNVFLDMVSPIALGPPCYECNDTSGTTTFVHNVTWPPRDSLYILWPRAPYTPPPQQISVAESLNVYAYPMFVDDSTYCPQTGSPLIDAGDPNILDADGSRSDVGWTGGPDGLTCEYVELPPLPPESLDVSGEAGLVEIAWSSRPEADLSWYRLYRGASSGFWMPGLPVHRIVDPPDTTVTDTLLSAGDSYYYVVTAVDTAGLESDPSVERSYIVSGVFDDPAAGDVPRSPRLLKVYPNPFNASTQVEVIVPSGTDVPVDVKVEVCDVLGRRVSTRRSSITHAGTSSLTWDARSDSGQALASGVYFLRLTIGTVVLSPAVRLVLLK